MIGSVVDHSHAGIFDYFKSNTYDSLQNTHSKKIGLKFARAKVVKASFFSSVIPLWNNLSTNLVGRSNSDTFMGLWRALSSLN